MEVYSELINIEKKVNISSGTAIALGKFDGIHKGHRALIDMVAAEKANGLVPAVFTFARAPRELIDHNRQKYILTSGEKRLFMKKNGIELMIEHPLNEVILGTEPEAFIRDILITSLNVRKIFCGSDFRFGHNRKGDAALLKSLEKKYGYKTVIIDKLKYGDREISSSYIREEIGKGSVVTMNEMLGYPYTIIGVVTEGKKLGRTLGFPTANIIPEEDKLLPPNGVYFTEAVIDNRKYAAITNIGLRPTVAEDGENVKKITVETHLLDTDMDMYGKTLELQFLEFIRHEKKFESVEELGTAVHKDIDLRRSKNR